MYYNVVSTWRDDAAHLLLVNTPYLSWITREALREGRAVPRSHNVEIEVKNHFFGATPAIRIISKKFLGSGAPPPQMFTRLRHQSYFRFALADKYSKHH